MFDFLDLLIGTGIVLPKFIDGLIQRPDLRFQLLIAGISTRGFGLPAFQRFDLLLKHTYLLFVVLMEAFEGPLRLLGVLQQLFLHLSIIDGFLEFRFQLIDAPQEIFIGALWLDLRNIVHVEHALYLLGFGQPLAGWGRLLSLVKITHNKYAQFIINERM